MVRIGLIQLELALRHMKREYAEAREKVGGWVGPLHRQPTNRYQRRGAATSAGRKRRSGTVSVLDLLPVRL